MTLDVKICGLKTAEAMEAALVGGANLVGFIFFPKSPRNIEPDVAAQLSAAARGRAKTVAVTVDATDTLLDEIVAKVQPDLLQLHGKESPQRVAEIKARYGLSVIKAFSISDSDDLLKIEPFIGIADRFLLDAKAPADSQLPGGNGVSFDWRLLSRLDPATDYLLSGGLNISNIEEALSIANPPGIDLSSGVESAPGQKDIGLIKDFMRVVRPR